MRVCLLFLVACVSLLLVSAHATDSNHIVKEQLQGVPSGWEQLSRASPDQKLQLLFLVKQQQLDVLESTFFSVSDPSNPSYGQYLSLDEVNSLVAPHSSHVAAIMQWLRSHGMAVEDKSVTATDNNDMIRVDCTVAQAERLLHTQYYEFVHSQHRNVQLVRALSYKLPVSVADFIDAVGPTVRFPSSYTIANAKVHKPQPASRRPHHKKGKMRRMIGGSAPNDPCDQGTTPTCLRSLYSVNNYVSSSTNNSVAVTGYLEQYISLSDLSSFFQTYDPTNQRPANIVGPNDPTNPGTEASLDIQYVMALSPGVPATFWYTAGRQPNSTDNEPFLDFLLALASDPHAPWVISTSYGDDEPTVNFQYASRMNVEFQKAAVRGISILFSSGDGGVSGGQSQQCTVFIPTFPAGSPYVTSVGGTTQFNPEVGVGFSSGGFTNYWSTPSYQQSFTSNYLTQYASSLPPSNLFNSSGRGFPDVSAQGTNYPVVIGGSTSPVDGTSCSTPAFSGIVALLNDIRFSQGKSSLGFLNPLFYANPTMFTDITQGNNPGCNTNGFYAQPGWDPITGLGTPNFAKMASVVKNLP